MESHLVSVSFDHSLYIKPYNTYTYLPSWNLMMLCLFATFQTHHLAHYRLINQDLSTSSLLSFQTWYIYPGLIQWYHISLAVPMRSVWGVGRYYSKLVRRICHFESAFTRQPPNQLFWRLACNHYCQQVTDKSYRQSRS